MTVFHRFVCGALAVCASTVASSQHARSIEVGQSISENKGTATDFYRFAAESGMMVQATLSAPGNAAVVLYTPAGEEMISAHGAGVVKLEAIIPLDDVFYLSVLRQDKSKPYSLKIVGDQPEPAVAFWARFIGFDSYDRNLKIKTKSRCWIDPGVKFKESIKGKHSVQTIGRNGRAYHAYAEDVGYAETYESQLTVKGDEVIVVYKYADGSSSKEHRYPRTPKIEPRLELRYAGYMCTQSKPFDPSS